MKHGTKIIAGIMLAASLAFLAYALGHPEASLPWNNSVSYSLYGVYVVVMVVLFLVPEKTSK